MTSCPPWRWHEALLHDPFPLLYPFLLSLSTCLDKISQQSHSYTPPKGCTSFFCMGVAPPRMGRSRTARVPRVRCARRGSEAFSLGSRSRQVACLELRVRSTQEKAQQQPFDLLPPLLILCLLPGHTKRSAGEESLTGGLLHGFLPAVIADTSAQSQHRIDLSAFPMHTWPFESVLDDAGVGTLDTSTANGPAVLLKARIVPEGFALL